jgi:hypothetical protein
MFCDIASQIFSFYILLQLPDHIPIKANLALVYLAILR